MRVARFRGVILLLAATCTGCPDEVGQPGGEPPDGFVPADVSIDVTDTATETETSKPPPCSTESHPGDECNMVAQDCADKTKTCRYEGTVGHATCVSQPVGTGTKGDACDDKNPCDKGLFCYRNRCSPACCPGDSAVCGKVDGKCDLSITDPGTGAVVYHVCSYATACHPFAYDCPTGDVCLFRSEPDTFACSTPAPGSTLDAKPGKACKYVNDCGESQACFSLSSGGDAGTGNLCYLFCWLDRPETFTPGTKPDGRFPADGSCTVSGTSYGKCTKVGGVSGGLGICVP